MFCCIVMSRITTPLAVTLFCACTKCENVAKSKAQQGEKKYAKSRPETPRYGNFDVNEAFFNAVERSFGEKEED